MDMSELANRARSLHRQGLTPTQIRNRSGFLDHNNDPCLPIATIQNWLAGVEGTATPQPPSAAPSLTHSRVAMPTPLAVAPTPGTQPREDHRELHDKLARLEAQLQRLSLERDSRTPSPAPSSPVSQGRGGRSRAGSRSPAPHDTTRELVIDQLKEMNNQLMVQLAAANQLIVAALGAADRRDSTPAASPAVLKPFKDWLPQVKPYGGEADRSPEAFLSQYYLYARQQNVPASERARQLIGKLIGPAQNWYTLTFANDPGAATEAQVALGLRKAFGQEYAGVRALRAIYHVNPLPTQSGAQRLLALDQCEQQALQHRVPRDAGPCETRFCRVLALFLPDELNHFLSELTADPRCSEEALRQLEETPALFEEPDTAGRASLMPTSPAREALFAARVEVAEAALRRLSSPSQGSTRGRLARADGSLEIQPAPAAASWPVASPSLPAPATGSPSATIPADYIARCSRVTAEHAAHSAGTAFVGPPHYFGDNTDPARKTKNQAELKRRRAGGFCFKCLRADLKEVPFLECSLHGALASSPAAATVERTRAAQKRG